MPWVEKRGNLWIVRRRLPGGRKRKEMSTPSEKQARSHAETLNAAKRKARTPEDEALYLEATAAALRGRTVTLAEFVADFISARGSEVRPSTLAGYQTHLDRIVRAFPGATWRTVTLGRVTHWLQTQRNANSMKRTLKAFGRYVHAEGMWPDNPLMRLKAKPANVRSKTVTDEEFARIEERIGGTPLFAIVCAARFGAMRVGEAVHARLENVNRKERTLAIIAYGGWRPKSRERTITLHDKLFGMIPEGDRGWAFMREDGQPWTRHQVAKGLRRATGDGSLHRFRRTCATKLELLGAPLAVIRDFLGHGNVATTSLYLHPSLEDQREAIDRLQA